MTESKENVEHLDLDVAEILVRKIPDDQQLIDLRLCVLVSADVGKSTLLGVLTPQGELDNSGPRAAQPLNMFRYLNEIQSGRTSSISHEIVGNVMLVVSATAGVVGMTQGELCRGEKIKLLFRHLIFRASRFLGIAVALEVPFFVVITKVNMVPEEQLKKISDTVASILKSAGAAKARRCRLWWTLATTASRRPAPASTATWCTCPGSALWPGASSPRASLWRTCLSMLDLSRMAHSGQSR